jgi:hypothetical protein
MGTKDVKELVGWLMRTELAARNEALWAAERAAAARAVCKWWDECVSEPDARGVRRAVVGDSPVYFRGADQEDVIWEYDPRAAPCDALTEAIDRAAGPGNVYWPHARVGNPELAPPEDAEE